MFNINKIRVMSKNPFEIKKTPRAIISAQAINLDDFMSKGVIDHKDDGGGGGCGTVGR